MVNDLLQKNASISGTFLRIDEKSRSVFGKGGGGKKVFVPKIIEYDNL